MSLLFVYISFRTTPENGPPEGKRFVKTTLYKANKNVKHKQKELVI